MRGVADLQAALDRFAKLADDEIVGLGEGGERAGLRADIAELDRLCCAMAGDIDAARRERGAAGRGIFQQRAAV